MALIFLLLGVAVVAGTITYQRAHIGHVIRHRELPRPKHTVPWRERFYSRDDWGDEPSNVHVIHEEAES